MIPTQLRIQIPCDKCGSSRTFNLPVEAIDAQGFDAVLEEALRDEAWSVCYPYTVCAHCIEEIIEDGLRHLADKLEAEAHPESAEVSS